MDDPVYVPSWEDLYKAAMEANRRYSRVQGVMWLLIFLAGLAGFIWGYKVGLS